ncbi:hypothetical protein Adt_24097 [Abeliophyllum distichum]|uniref:Uncharacterized protein n=1 Tax=Abeliophyllum distichum TaxID=126358 RepID=A0ABD1SFS2_9LAMI
MFVNLVEREASSSVEDEASPSVSPSMANVPPIRGVDTSTDEEMAITSTYRLIGDGDLSSIVSIRWAAMGVQSIMVEVDMDLLRESYMVAGDIELIILGLHEQACFLMRKCNALYLHSFVAGMRLPLHHIF